jgi:D-aspartate ligase
MPHYAGTLATARHLAARGVEVAIASDRVLAAAAWSRYVVRRAKSPPVVHGPAEMAAWLGRYGNRYEGAVLYPTSDDMAWVVARYAEKLRQRFRLYVPPLEAMRSLLDKSVLYEVCMKLGVPAPKSWFPRSASELADLCDGKRSLLLKPRAQMFYPGGKGERIVDREHGLRTWRLYRSNRYAPGVLEEQPSLDLPFVQEYEPTATQGTYSISGFVEPSGRILGARASTKLLQTARVGIGMCFLASEVEPTPLRHVAEVAKSVGYYGAFEVEFVNRNGTYLMIDFNPRYYGQMGFDIARGVPLPWLIHNAAQGRTGGLDQLFSNELPADAPTFYCDRVALTWWLGMAVASGGVGRRDALRWYRMLEELSAHSIDASWKREDPLPSLIGAAAVAWHSLRNPFSFVRSLRNIRDAYQQPIAPPGLEAARRPAHDIAELSET